MSVALTKFKSERVATKVFLRFRESNKKRKGLVKEPITEGEGYKSRID